MVSSFAFFTYLFALTTSVWASVKSPVEFRVELTWEPRSPDGFERNVALVNGQFPGPRLELTEGDDVHFLVENNMPFNTTIHFHGIEQMNTLWSDGVPGVTQRPIGPGEKYLYKWTATQYGSYWYHAHARGQIDDGLFGPILIHPPFSEEPKLPFRDITEDPVEILALMKAQRNSKPLIVHDWRHQTSGDLFEIEKASGLDAICPDSILVNGKGSVKCPTPEEIADAGPVMTGILGNETLTDKGCVPPTNQILQGDFEHDYSKLPDGLFYKCKDHKGPHEVFEVGHFETWASFDIISAAGLNVLSVSIDEHPMWVYAVDGRHVEPYLVHLIHADAGARYSVFVKLDKSAGDYAIRANTVGFNQALTGSATLSYKGRHEQPDESTPYIDRFGNNVTADAILFDHTKAVPYPPEAPAKEADETFIFDVGRFGKSYLWTVNGVARYPEPDVSNNKEPLLFTPTSANDDLTVSTRNNTWVDLIFRSKPFNPPHPMHKHTNKVFIIGSGNGEFPYKSVAEAAKVMPENFNLENPLLRDGWFPPPAVDGPTWVAVRYHVINPGPSFLHCHIQIHLTGGMALTIMDGVDVWPAVPEEYLNGNGGVGQDDDLSLYIDL